MASATKIGILEGMEQTQLWQRFALKNNLTHTQLEQFQQYHQMLTASNELFNITTITDVHAVLAYHFEDSFKLGDVVDMNTIRSICDVGTGGGFPGIPLKIMYPHLRVLLLEVSRKKIAFLETVIERLELTDIEICDLDWRTFLRKVDTPIDLFCARASLHPDELIRIFSPACAYNTSLLVYWASAGWQPTKKEKPFLKKMYEYRVGDRKRFYEIFCAMPSSRFLK